jgi:hypothetical protein
LGWALTGSVSQSALCKEGRTQFHITV